MSLTPTQKIILRAAVGHGGGLVCFALGDRRGTRVRALRRGDEVPIIIAYSNPEGQLKSRGLIEPLGDDRYTWRITDAGRAAIARCRP